MSGLALSKIIGAREARHAMPVYEPKREEQVYRNIFEQQSRAVACRCGAADFRADDRRDAQSPEDEDARPECLIVMQEDATDEQIQAVIDRMVALNFTVHRSTGIMHTVLGGVGSEDDIDPAEFEVLDGREGSAPHRLTLQAGEPQFPAGRDRGSDKGTSKSAAMPWSRWLARAASKIEIRSKRAARWSPRREQR